MRFVPTEIPEVLLVEPDVHGDDRGFFLETYHLEKYRRGGIADAFVQDNHSRSGQRVLRGLHAQRLHPQGKLVRAVEGAIFDVAVDIRRGSPSFRSWVGRVLSADNHHQLWVPPGFAHGFCVLSDGAQVEYKCTALYDQADEIVVAWNDPSVGVRWPVEDPILSAKDAAAPRLEAILDLLPTFAAGSR